MAAQRIRNGERRSRLFVHNIVYAKLISTISLMLLISVCLVVSQGSVQSKSHVFSSLSAYSSGWSNAVAINPPNDASHARSSEILSSSCPSAGNCVGVGYFSTPDGSSPSIFIESNYLWSSVSPIPLPSNFANNGNLDQVVCSSVSNCIAVGEYSNSSGNVNLFSLTDSNGTWGNIVELSLPPGLPSYLNVYIVNGLICFSFSNCEVLVSGGNDVYGLTNVFSEAEVGGVWQNPISALLPPGISSMYYTTAYLPVLSCIAQGECYTVLSFTYPNGSGSDKLYLYSLSGGTWKYSQPNFPSGESESFNEPSKVYCESFGNCLLIVMLNDSSGTVTPYVINEINSTWQSAVSISTPANTSTQSPGGNVTGLYCASLSQCDIIGTYSTASSPTAVFAESGNLPATPLEISSAQVGYVSPNGLTNSNDLTCTSYLNCISLYSNSSSSTNNFMVFTLNNGVWDSGVSVSEMLGASNRNSYSIPIGFSCFDISSCLVFAGYTDSNGDQLPYYVEEKSGVWQTPSNFPTPSSIGFNSVLFGENSTISCSTPNFCDAVGIYSNASNARSIFGDHEINGVWQNPTSIKLPLNANNVAPSQLFSHIECVSFGSCQVIGTYVDTSGLTDLFAVSENSGIWGSTIQIQRPANAETTNPNFSNDVLTGTLSCFSQGNCETIGSYYDALGLNQNFDLKETNGTWGIATPINVPFGYLLVNSSLADNFASTCTSIGNCLLIGTDIDSNLNGNVYEVSQVNGIWQTPNQLQVSNKTQLNLVASGQFPTFNSLKCSNLSNCEIIGNTETLSGQSIPFYVNQINGAFQAVNPLPISDSRSSSVSSISIDAMSCPVQGSCEAVGEYLDSNGNQQVFVEAENNFIWEGANTLTYPQGYSVGSIGFNSEQHFISCSSPGNCNVLFPSVYGSETFSFIEIGGNWNVGVNLAPSYFSLTGVLISYTVETDMSCVSQVWCQALVAVNNNAGGVSLDSYTFTATYPPIINSLSPSSGSSLGGTSVVITGSSFTGTTSVDFGTTPAKSFSVISDTEIDAVTPSGVGVVNVNITNANGSSTPTAQAVFTYSGYFPLSPIRICDTRTYNGTSVIKNQCDGSGPGTLKSGSTINVNVTSSGVPANATAVVVNVTATNTTSNGGFLTIWPAGAEMPTSSNLNFNANSTVANLVQVGIGANGDISIYNYTGSSDVIVDLEGYFAPVSTVSYAGLYNPLSPIRICDTRTYNGTSIIKNQCDSSGPETLTSGHIINVNVTSSGVPANATAVVVNVTATNTTSNGGFLTIWPSGSTTPPNASNLNFNAGQSVPNRVIVPINATTGDISIYNYTGSADITVDLNGYFSGSTNTVAGYTFTPLTPIRICDTRSYNGSSIVSNQCDTGPNHTLISGSKIQITSSGIVGIPVNAKAVVLNVTATGTTSNGGFVTIYPAQSGPAPIISDLNFNQNATVANLVEVGIGNSSAVDAYNYIGSTDLIVDVMGYYI